MLKRREMAQPVPTKAFLQPAKAATYDVYGIMTMHQLQPKLHNEYTRAKGLSTEVL